MNIRFVLIALELFFFSVEIGESVRGEDVYIVQVRYKRITTVIAVNPH